MPRSDVVAVLDRLAPWSTTGVGSLPYTEAKRAVSQATRGYDLPFCPQLPRLEGDMLVEWLGADPHRCGWSPERDRERPRAWDTLLRELTLRAPAHAVVKLQVTGPLTLTLAMQRERGTSARPDRGLRHEVSTWLAANVKGQVTTLRERGLDVLLVVDEPGLTAVFDGGDVDDAWDPLRSVGATWGLHVCCAVPWDVVDAAAPDVLSFDLVLAPIGRRGGTALRRLAARGGRVIWGLLPVEREESEVVTASRLNTALAQSGIDGSRSLLSASCGTGRVSPRREAALAKALYDHSRARRELSVSA